MKALVCNATARCSMQSRTCAAQAPHRICTAVRHRKAQRISYSVKDQSKPQNKEYDWQMKTQGGGELSSLENLGTGFKQPDPVTSHLGSHMEVKQVMYPTHNPGPWLDTPVDDVFRPAVVTNAVKGADASVAGDRVPWADFWKQLETISKTSKLNYTAFAYRAHSLHLGSQREKFQWAVARGSSTSSSTELSRGDFDSLLSQTSSNQLAEAVDLAMNMVWTEYYGGDGEGMETQQVQAPAGRWIKAWDVGTQDHQAGATGSSIIMLQGNLGERDWLPPVYAYEKQARRGTTYDVNIPERIEEFTQVHGTHAEGQGLTTFMDLPTAGAGNSCCTRWVSIEPERLPLDLPARIVGYQARVKEIAEGQKVIDSVRFLVRSFSRGETLYPAAFISYTGKDSEARLFATQLATSLKSKKIPCFFAESQLTAGVEWAPAIRDMAAHCQVFVPVVSPKYLERAWCLTELHLAVNRNAVGAESVPVLVSGLGLTKDDIVDLAKDSEELGDKQQAWLEKWEDMHMASAITKNAGVETLTASDILADFGKLLKKGLDEQLLSSTGVKDVAKTVARYVRR